MRGRKEIRKRRGYRGMGVHKTDTKCVPADSVLWTRIHNGRNQSNKKTTNNDQRYDEIDTENTTTIRKQNTVCGNRNRTIGNKISSRRKDRIRETSEIRIWEIVSMVRLHCTKVERYPDKETTDRVKQDKKNDPEIRYRT